MDLLRVGLEVEGEVSGETVGKVLRVEVNEGMATRSGSTESGVTLDAALGVALDGVASRMLGAAGTTLDVAVGRVLGSTSEVEGMSIEIEEGRLIGSTN